jgi:flagellar FliL protein
MSAETTDAGAVRKPGKRLLIPLILGLVLAGAGGAGGYWAVTSGPLAPAGGGPVADGGAPEAQVPAMPPTDVAFVPLETLVISLGPGETARHLMFTAELEVDPAHAEEVSRLSPRVLDVLNSYLRVISVAELSDPTSLARLRAQMLRRIQVVTGTGRVHDLLVTQFVVN